MSQHALKPGGVRLTGWQEIVPAASPTILATFILLLVVATVLRCRGALNSLWLDEIWSLDLAATVRSPLDIFTSLHHENNHYLNTLYLYLAGNHGDWPGYRIPSLLAGIGSVFMAWLIGRRRSLVDALFSLTAIAFSYVLILYSSEARGYATTVFCAFLAYYLLEGYLQDRRPGTSLLFSLVAVLGLLSHLMFASVLCSAVVWSCWRLIHDRTPLKGMLTSMTALFTAPLMISLILYWVDIRKITEGGGDEVPFLVAFRHAMAWVLGTSPSPVLINCSALAAFAILVGGLYLLRQEKNDALIFYLSVTLVFPLLLVFLRSSTALYVRHFLIPIAFIQLLLGFSLAAIYQRVRGGKIISSVLLAIYLLSNCWYTSALIRYGRGDYRNALGFMAAVSKGNEITVGNDHDFRIGTVLKFQDKSVLRGKTLRDFGESGWPPGGPEWLIFHKESYEDPTTVSHEVTDRENNRYGLIRTVPTAPLTGLHWYIYHNVSKTVD